MLNRGLDKLELLRIVESVANEKSIDKELVIESMESAIQKAALTKFGNDNSIEVTIDRKNGEIKIKKVFEIVEKPEDVSREITLEQAKKIEKQNKDLKVGDKIFEELPQIDFGRIAAQSAKQVISQRVKEAEKTRQYEEFIDKEGQILSGIIKRLEYGNVIMDLGKAEGVIKKDELIPREILKTGDRVKAYCYEVKKEIKGHQIFLSRAHPQFLARLFFQEVPEIYDGIIEVKSVSRDPGSRAKIAVYTKEKSIDPVGACVGMRGSRVQAVVNELQGEKIDIVLWSEDIATFVVNALGPAEVDKVIIEEDLKKIDVIVPDEQLSLAIGRKGQNVRLASSLSGWSIDILTTSQESDRRNEEFKNLSQKFISQLDVDEVIAHLLVTEGFSSIDEVALVSLEELTSIEGFDENLSKELIERAKACVEKIRIENLSKLKESGFDDYLLNNQFFNTNQLMKLNENQIKTRDQLADLSNSELIEIFREMDKEKADEIIMDSRKHWFKS